MIRKPHIIAILALGLAATAVRTSPVVGRLVSSTLSLPHIIRDSKASGGALSPIERFVFSVVLTDAKACEKAVRTQQHRS